MKNRIKIALIAACITQSASAAEIYSIKYKGFTLLYNCDDKMAMEWKYTARKDTGNFPRSDDFFLDPNLPSRCQQTSRGTYKTPKGAVKYDRGHLVPANAMDSDPTSIKQSNIMTNVLPQVAQMNRGAWYQTELYVECRRDKEPITVVGGVYKGTMPKDGNFMISHGINAPEAFWKVAYGTGTAIGWWIPNSVNAVASNIDNYIVSVKEIEEKLGRKIDVPYYFKTQKPTRTEALTTDCKRS